MDIPIFVNIEALPPRVGILWLEGVATYEDPSAGVCFRYRYPENNDSKPNNDFDDLEIIAERMGGPKISHRLIKADAYLYNLGLSEIPKDITSEAMVEIFHYACSDIAAVVEQGHYSLFEVMKTAMLSVPPSAPEPMWLWAAMRYRQVNQPPHFEDDQDRVSHLAVRSDGMFINKVRYTYPASIPANLAYADFLLFLFEWQYSVKQLVAGKTAVPASGSPEDSEWVRAVTELRNTMLPNPLWLFDPEVAMARQAEMVADHFQAETDGPEYQTDKHEAKEAIQHEIAHAIFAYLEKEMALKIDIGGFGTFVDARTPSET